LVLKKYLFHLKLTANITKRIFLKPSFYSLVNKFFPAVNCTIIKLQYLVLGLGNIRFDSAAASRFVKISHDVLVQIKCSGDLHLIIANEIRVKHSSVTLCRFLQGTAKPAQSGYASR